MAQYGLAMPHESLPRRPHDAVSAKGTLSCENILEISEPLIPPEAYLFLSETLTPAECEEGDLECRA